MYRLLVLKAFEQAQKKIKRDEPYTLARELVNHIEAKTQNTYTEKSLVSKYQAAQKGINQISLKSFVVDSLCNYLDYPNFQEFERDNPTTKTPALWFLILWKKCWFKFLTYHIFLVLLGISVYNYAVRERWMIWNEVEYIEVKLDIDTYNLNQLRRYKEDRILYFKKIIPDCDTKFFKEDGSENLWYEKNAKKELEYFTDMGLHPETGTTLKKITPYMIRTYICPSYE